MNKSKKESNMIRSPRIGLVCLASGCLFALVSCGKQEAPKTTSPPTAPLPTASVTAPVAAAARLATPQEVALVPDGTQLVSPESGKVIQKNASTPALVHDGRLYFICCAVSLQKCLGNPSLLQDAKPPNGYELRKLAGSST